MPLKPALPGIQSARIEILGTILVGSNPVGLEITSSDAAGK